MGFMHLSFVSVAGCKMTGFSGFRDTQKGFWVSETPKIVMETQDLDQGF